MQYRLIFLTGPARGRRLAIQQGTVVLGRDPDCHVPISDDEVSRKHAVIERRPDGIHIRDLGSTNGIILSGIGTREARLKHNDIFEIGRTRIQFQEMRQEETLQRRVGLVQALAVVAVAFVLIVQMAFLIGLSVWRRDVLSLSADGTRTNDTQVASADEPVAREKAPEPPPPAPPAKETQPPAPPAEPKPEKTPVTTPPEPAAPPPAPAAPIAPITVTPPNPASAPANPPTLPRRIQLVSAEPQKFPASDQYDEMRLLRVTMRSAPGERKINSALVRVLVEFFDEDVKAGTVSPSRAVVPYDAASVDGPWNVRDDYAITAAYIVPRGFRRSEEKQLGARRQFHGYVVKVFYGDVLQDQDAHPFSLLDKAPR